jgi:hypothetical protein
LDQSVISCPRCERRTPAARAVCIYCAEPLPAVEIETAPPQRNIEAGDLAFNTVLQPSSSVAETSISALASALTIEADEAAAFVRAAKPLPVARCQHRQEADMIATLIRTCGLRARVLADEEFHLGMDLVRARKLTPGDTAITVHHSGGTLTLNTNEIKLLVVGSLRKTRVDYSESISGGRTRPAGVLESSQFMSDETVLDVYGPTLEQSFRIKADAFDYSGLAHPLSYRADLNLKASIEALGCIAPQARLDSDFSKVRGLLSRAWPERSRNESRGIRRTGISFRPVSKQSIISDNSDQFDRYSRLMFLFSG